jgi:hypothetical protein
LRALFGIDCHCGGAADVVATVEVGAEGAGVLVGEAVVDGCLGQHIDEMPNIIIRKVHEFVDVCQR